MKWGNFSAKALDFIDNSNAWLNIAHGSVRSSKTINCTVRWLKYVRQGPPGTLAMLGKTRTTLQRNVLNDLAATVGSRNFHWANKSEGHLRLCGRDVYCLGANDERAEGVIRGATFAGSYCDELSLYPESVFNQLLARNSVQGAQIFANTNPDSPYHWLNQKFILNSEIRDKRVWHFTMDDNPNLDSAYKARLMSAYTGLWYKRMILGLWVMAEGSIYDMFDEATHTIDDAVLSELAKTMPFKRLWVACDYGTGNPTVFLLQGNIGDKVYTIDEYYYDSRAASQQKTDGEYAEDLKKFLSGRRVPVVIDPSAASFIAEVEKKQISVERADNAVLDGIRNVSSLLAQKKYFIAKRCKNTIMEKYGYVWDAKAQKNGIDAPLKQNDHASDCERYGIMHFLNGGAPPTFRFNF